MSLLVLIQAGEYVDDGDDIYRRHPTFVAVTPVRATIHDATIDGRHPLVIEVVTHHAHGHGAAVTLRVCRCHAWQELPATRHNTEWQ